MLTDEDIKKLVEAESEVFPTKLEFQKFQEEMHKDFARKLGLKIAIWKKIFPS